MKDLFLSKDIIDAYLVDLIDRLYCQANSPKPTILCPIGTSGIEVCNAMLKLLPSSLQPGIAVVNIHLDRGISGGVSFYNVDSETPMSLADIQATFNDKTLLLVDGLAYSGGTLGEAYEAVKEYTPRGVISYSTVLRFSSGFIPNYFSVLVGTHDKAWLRIDEKQSIPNKRLDGLGCIRKLHAVDLDKPMPTPSKKESLSRDFRHIFSSCKENNTTETGCFVYERESIIRGYLVFNIDKAKSALILNEMAIGSEYEDEGIPGCLLRWMETYSNAKNLDYIHYWVDKDDFGFHLTCGDDFIDLPPGGASGASGAMMKRRIPYPLPYGHGTE